MIYWVIFRFNIFRIFIKRREWKELVTAHGTQRWAKSFVILRFFVFVWVFFILFSRGMNKRITRARYRFTLCSASLVELVLYFIRIGVDRSAKMRSDSISHFSTIHTYFPSSFLSLSLSSPPSISMSSSTNVSTRVLISGVNSA